ncbi:MAG: gamma carbonic anhydrase family protein [Myxococcota bacterium]
MIYSLGPHTPTFDSDEYFVAPNAAVIGRVRVGHQASIWFSAVLRGDVEDIVIGEGVNLQDGAVLHADAGFPCVVESDVTVGHLAMLHGCTIGAGSMVGMNATILNGAKIGKNCIIGANALISEGKVIPDNSLVLGVPGKVVREVSEGDREMVAFGAKHYRSNGRFFRENLQAIDS